MAKHYCICFAIAGRKIFLRIRTIEKYNYTLESRLKFFKEASIVFREHTQVANTILQIGDTLYTHTKGIACIYLAIDATSLKHVRVYHSTAQDFYPSCMLAEATALTTTNMARDIHFGTWLCKWEIAWTKTYLCIFAKHLASKC